MSSEKDCGAEQKIAALQERVKLLEARLDLPGWLAKDSGPVAQSSPAEQLKPAVELQCTRCGGKTFKATPDKRLQCAGCDSLGPFEHIARTSKTQREPAHERESIQQRIAERRQEEIVIRSEAHLYLQNGPAEQRHTIRGQDDLGVALKALLMVVQRGKAIELSFREVA